MFKFFFQNIHFRILGNTCGVIFTYSSYSKVWEISFQVIDIINKIFPNNCNPTTVREIDVKPGTFQLSQNFPNPFNPSTIISYQIPVASHVILKVYDVLCKEVATLVDEFKNPGFYNSQFSIRNTQLSSGFYFYRLTAGNYSETKKMLILK